MTRTERKMVEKNLDLIFEFEKYVLEHPELARKIPRNAVVSMRVEGAEAFNCWSERLLEKHLKAKRPVFVVTIKRMRPATSRIEEIEVGHAA